MDFEFDADQDLLRATTRRFLEQRYPMGEVRKGLEDDDVFDRTVWAEGAQLGWTAMLVPAEHGGGSVSEQPLVDAVVLAEEMGRALYPGPFLATNVVAAALADAGTDEQPRACLPGLADGQTVASWCFTGDGGCDPAAVAVTARPDGDGWRLDGTARFVPDAHLADRLLITAREPSGELLLALVDRAAAGLDVRVMRGVDLTRRLGAVTLDGVIVADADVLDRPAEARVERAAQVALVLLCAESVGAADRALELAVAYAKQRVQFGRLIGSFQAIKHKLADMLIELEAARAVSHYAALAVDGTGPDAGEAVAVAATVVGEAASRICGDALQVHGGIGFTWEHDMHLFVRRAKANEALYGHPGSHAERVTRLLAGSTG